MSHFKRMKLLNPRSKIHIKNSQTIFVMALAGLFGILSVPLVVRTRSLANWFPKYLLRDIEPCRPLDVMFQFRVRLPLTYAHSVVRNPRYLVHVIVSR